MTGKLFSTIIAIVMFIGSLAGIAATLFTSLTANWPDASKYAVIATLISTGVATWLPRIQKIGQTLDEASNK